MKLNYGTKLKMNHESIIPFASLGYSKRDLIMHLLLQNFMAHNIIKATVILGNWLGNSIL
jgi:hypothetical protein